MREGYWFGSRTYDELKEEDEEGEEGECEGVGEAEDEKMRLMPPWNAAGGSAVMAAESRGVHTLWIKMSQSKWEPGRMKMSSLN